ncbi:hypothetical protein SAMN04487857_1372 [Pseudomonas sp. ok272]|uniref:SH3 domain-containing protein n=1 Tax=unclassified Pseudomonas TaxID=196821 RepID=UPI0008C5F022|nr:MULTISPECIES: SH3 domain-containing protein [unclassified Pseudomonas]SEN67723.1 hypothetical protein SAMN04487857_1372 [Pseudomonas sp. ok272]SFN47051.1 hypothetical protein SAMN04487858_1382 [Pseudomonas sp. ok602]
MLNLLTWLFGRPKPDQPSRPVSVIYQPPPLQPPAPPEPRPVTPAPIKNWSHPFGDRSTPLRQLTQLAQANAGYYPLGRNGMWHGGVHFDGGTENHLDQSHVRCLADGEVVAYRIPEHTPLSTFFPGSDEVVEAPFASGFVLVRHRLQAPRIKDSNDTPPSLIFYSLYMHLQDWASYQANPTLRGPAFWPEQHLRVRTDAADSRPGTSQPKGLKVYANQSANGHFLDLLPPGTPVVVSGEGKYRTLENTQGPALLRNADGSLRGYVAARYLLQVRGAINRVNAQDLRVRAAPNTNSEVLFTLHYATQVTVSGDERGEFLKLESISQYVPLSGLEGVPTPQAFNEVVVLNPPAPIKAGALIGHIGPYQDASNTTPQHQLHLEVFSGDAVEAFIKASRQWAERMPKEDRTWLKLAKGTALAPHREDYSARRRPIANTDDPLSATDLLIPKHLLDSLPPDRKIAVPLSPTTPKAYNWYRLDGLLNDADGQPLDGWVCEAVGITPWVSPWSWDGYEILHNRDSNGNSLAYWLRTNGYLAEHGLERFSDLADHSQQSLMRTRLHDIIDRNRDGQLTAEELQTALSVPAHAQSIARLVFSYDSEWRYTPRKWDALDDILGHTNSTPILNWIEEKKRIKELSWWDEVAGEVGLPMGGEVFYFHPIGLMGTFISTANMLDVRIREIGDIISHGEGSYESYNTGTKDVQEGRVGFSFLSPASGTITNKTINEIILTESLSGTNRDRMFATGKYQTVIETLKNAKSTLRLTGEEKYTPDMQEKVFSEYLLEKAGGGALAKFIKYGKGELNDAQNAAAKEWASIAVPSGYRIKDGRISDGTLSYYESSANRANSESTKRLRIALEHIGSTK